MNAKFVRAFLATGALAGLCATWGCVSDRPSRNGVYNENQYVKKAFLIRPGDGAVADTGWLMRATITSASTPNPLGNMGLFVGRTSDAGLIRFQATSDKLQMLNMRELESQGVVVDTNGTNTTTLGQQGSREPEVVNSWPITNVDLKYRINLDGEKTNYYEENQELDWQVRQWVKVNFDNNNLSDLAPLGTSTNFMVAKCTDLGLAATTLVPNSFLVDETNGYMQFSVDVTIPVKTDDASCMESYGNAINDFQSLGRQNVNLTLMYSMTRATPPEKLTYTPFVVDEKNPIRRKYGVFEQLGVAIDPNSELLGGRAMAYRYDPNQPLTWYFAPGYPDSLKFIWNDPNNGIAAQTNAILNQAGAKAQMTVKNFDQDLAPGQAPREFGDIRYNFVRYYSDVATGSPFVGATQFAIDPRTGQNISTIINVQEAPLQDLILSRLDFYLTEVGAISQFNPDGTWVDGPAGCQDGDTLPLDPKLVQGGHNADSTVYGKMQGYLQKSVQNFGKLGPADFIYPHVNADGTEDTDFYRAFYALMPYLVFNDPDANQYVRPEGGTGVYASAPAAGNYSPSAEYAALSAEAQFHALAGQLDKGWAPFDVTTGGPAGVAAMNQFLATWKGSTLNHRDLQYMTQMLHGRASDTATGMVNYLQLFQKDARHCINGTWETRDQYVNRLLTGYKAFTMWHEFGHAMGLRHNFMGSMDRPNYPTYQDNAATPRTHIGMYSSSVMEYNAAPDTLFWANGTGSYGWGPYDQAAIGWLYANAQTPDTMGPDGNTITAGPKSTTSLSGQTTATSPYADPLGWNGSNEVTFLRCTDEHVKFTPFCRPDDFGATPSEIVAAQIDNYEWNYKWRNFRLYHKFWSEESYANTPTYLLNDLNRFLSAWSYDWSQGELQDSLRRIGITPPAPTGNNPAVPQQEYYADLTNHFTADMSAANQMVAAFTEAIVQQSSGERPYKTLFDNYFGDVTQQGITIDKLDAIQEYTALWKTDNYDPNQAQGAYIASFTQDGDPTYQTVAEAAVDSMVGGIFDSFPFYKPLAVSQFSQATHDINFGGRVEVRDWIGGKTFTRERDFLDYFCGIAEQLHAAVNADGSIVTSLSTCTYDPRLPRAYGYQIHLSDNYNRFMGPDDRRYIWAYIADRNAWVICDQDRNTATYQIMFNYTADVIFGEDDGNSQGVWGLQLPMKYFIDYFNQYN